MVMWLRGDAVELDGAGNVISWTDKTGSGNNAIQTTAANRPLWNANHPSFNNQPVVNFSNQNNVPSLGHDFAADTSNFTIWMVMRTSTNVGSTNYCGAFGNSAVLVFAYENADISDKWGVYCNGGIISSSQLLYAAVRSCTLVCADTTSHNGLTFYTDGVQDVATGSGNYNGAAGILGCGNGGLTQQLNGDIAEVGYWQRTLSQAEVAQLEAYAKQRYEPQTFLPTDLTPELWLRADSSVSQAMTNFANTSAITTDGNNVTGGGTGWNTSGFNSVSTLSGNGTLSFSTTAVPSTFTFCGLSTSANVGGNYILIPFGIYFNDGMLQIWENGTDVANAGTYAAGDTFAVTVTGTTVTYYHNGNLIYTSLQTATFPLYAAGAFYDNGTITDIEFGVNTWYDLSGNGNDFIVGALSTPVVSPNTYNGLAALSGVDGTRGLTCGGLGDPGTSSTLVLNFTPSSLGSTYLAAHSGGAQSSIIERFTTTLVEWFNAGGTDRKTFATAPAAGLHQVIVTQVDGVSCVGYYDGVQAFSFVPTATIKSLNEILGYGAGSNGTDGDVAEVIQIGEALSPTQVAQLHVYSQRVWGTP
jgi:hypothetical protein